MDKISTGCHQCLNPLEHLSLKESSCLKLLRYQTCILKITSKIERNIRSVDAIQVSTSTQIENNEQNLNQKNFFGVIDQLCTKVEFYYYSNSLF